MDDMATFTKGQRVTFTDPKGVVCNGLVDAHRGGWVLIELDEPRETPQGWHGSKMMLRASAIAAC